MPTVLITGLNGFVAVHTAVVFLSNGWSVRGTVRSQAKAEKVKALPALADYAKDGKVELVVVEDLIKGDFTEALKGVDGIAHCASPWHFSGRTWEEYRDPAVEGTTNIFKQAAKFPNVKAISITSSFAAIGDFSKPAEQQKGRVYTEEDWMPLTEEDAANAKGDSAPQTWYITSKKLAELAAGETKKAENASYSFGSVCPPMILGPAIHYGKTTGEVLSKSDVSTTVQFSALAAGKDADMPPTAFPIYGDVRNVAQAMYEVVARGANGRFAICNGAYDYQQLADKARELFPELEQQGVIPKGQPGNHVSEKGGYVLDASKAERELGIKYIGKDQLVKDVIDQFIKNGVIAQ